LAFPQLFNDAVNDAEERKLHNEAIHHRHLRNIVEDIPEKILWDFMEIGSVE
jgi:hypothetical protein